MADFFTMPMKFKSKKRKKGQTDLLIQHLVQLYYYQVVKVGKQYKKI